MSNANFHWRKYEAAHWILSEITTSERTPTNSFWVAVSDYTPPPRPPDSYYYNYKEFLFSEIRDKNNSFALDELNEALNALNVNKHITIRPSEENPNEPIIKMKDEGRVAYESLFYLALRDQQKNTSVGLANAENSLGDFIKIQWYRHKNYVIAIIGLCLTIVILLLRLGCNK
jgi:hypothetical protein